MIMMIKRFHSLLSFHYDNCDGLFSLTSLVLIWLFDDTYFESYHIFSLRIRGVTNSCLCWQESLLSSFGSVLSFSFTLLKRGCIFLIFSALTRRFILFVRYNHVLDKKWSYLPALHYWRESVYLSSVALGGLPTCKIVPYEEITLKSFFRFSERLTYMRYCSIGRDYLNIFILLLWKA